MSFPFPIINVIAVTQDEYNACHNLYQGYIKANGAAEKLSKLGMTVCNNKITNIDQFKLEFQDPDVRHATVYDLLDNKKGNIFLKLDDLRVFCEPNEDIKSNSSFESVEEELDYDSFNSKMLNQPIVQTMPYCKAINTKAGLFIPNDCKEKAGWFSVQDVGIPYTMNTEQMDLKGEMVTVPGILIKAPKLVIIRRSPLLRYNKDLRRYDALYVYNRDLHAKERGEIQCARRYLVMFLDEEHKFFHTSPFQLTVKGNCMFKFDVNYKNFVCEMLSFKYGMTVTKFQENESTAWIASHCIFCPELKSEKVGEKNQSFACITTSFKHSVNGDDLFLTKEQGKIVFPFFKNLKEWYTKSFIKDLIFDNETKIISEVVDI